MTKSKTTKRALLVSAVSMLLCLAMLVGTTFAWFTDTVTTGKNTIIAGNLDVELYVRDSTGNYNAVGADDSLFDSTALWEPGHTEVAYLKVANAGTLALKYKLSVTVDNETSGTNVNGKTFKLSDYLVFGQVTGTSETIYATREDAQKAAGSTTGLNAYTKEGTLYSSKVAKEDSSKNSEEYVALIVYMPTTVGNEANYLTGTNAPQIELGVSLVATQTTCEEDGFGDDYDEYAPATFVSTADDLKTAIANGEDVVLTEDITLTAALTVNNDVTITGNGNAIKNYSVYVDSGHTVTFSNVGFADTTVVDKASSVYGSGFSGTLIFDGCSFGDSNWESIQITPKGDAEIVIKDCTFTAMQDMKRFIHIQPAQYNNYKIDVTIENCTFNGCDKVNFSADDMLSVIDLDYIAAGSVLTLGGCTFKNTDGSDCTGAHAYFCTAGSATCTYDYNTMYGMLTGTVATYTVSPTEVSNATALTNALSKGDGVVLSEDITLTSALTVEKAVTIDLNGQTLSYAIDETSSASYDSNNTTGTGTWMTVTDGGNLKITGGTLEANNMEKSTRAVIEASKGSSVTLDGVTFNTNGVALFPRGDTTEVNVINCTINGGAYAISTNAGTEENYGVVINVKNSTLTTENSTVLVNIPCTLNMTDTTVYGAFHGVVVRGGTAVLTNCTIINKITADYNYIGYFDNEYWGTGNKLTLGALVFGNKSDSYQYATSVKLINTTVTADNSAYTDGRDYPAIYGYGNSGVGIGATLTYDSDCVINGTIISGNEYATINEQSNFNSSTNTSDNASDNT